MIKGRQEWARIAQGLTADRPSAAAVGLAFGDQFAATDGGVVYALGPDSSGAPRWMGVAGALGANTALTFYLGGAVIRERATASSFVVDSGGQFDYLVLVTSTAAPRAITLPNPALLDDGRVYIVKDVSGGAGTNNITVAGAAGTIDGAANYVISTNYGLKGFVVYLGAFYTL